MAIITPRKMAPYVLGLLVVTITYLGYGDNLAAFFRVSTDNAFVRRDAVTLVTPVAGQVISLPFEEGSFVREGQTIVKVDRRQALIEEDGMLSRRLMALQRMQQIKRLISASSNRIASLDSSYGACRESEVIAVSQLKRLQALEARGFVAKTKTEEQKGAIADKTASCLKILADSQDEIRLREDSRVNLQLAREEIRNLSTSLKQSSDSIARALVRAPFDGTLWGRKVALGSEVQTGTQLYTLVSGNKLWIEANFREGLLNKIKAGMKVEVKSDAVPDHVFKGTVIAVGVATVSSFAPASVRSTTGSFTKVTQWVPVRIVLGADRDLQRLAAGTSCFVTVVK